MPNASPANLNQLFFRTDRHLLYYSDGTRWLSTTLYEQTLVARAGANNGLTGFGTFTMILPSNYRIWLEAVSIWCNIYNAQTSANHQNISGRAGFAPFDTTGAAAPNLYEPAFTPQEYSPSYEVLFSPTGSPGYMEVLPTVRYRLIG